MPDLFNTPDSGDQLAARLRRIADANVFGIAFTHKDGRVFYMNDEMLRIFGHSRAALDSGRVNWVASLHPRHAVETFTRQAALDRRAHLPVIERTIVRPDGTEVPVLAAVMTASPGDPERTVVMIDLTHIKETEHALRESEQRFRAVFEQAAVGISITDTTDRLVLANAGYAEMIGRPMDQIIGRTVSEFTHPDDREQTERVLSAVRTEHQPQDVEKRYTRPDGSIRWGQLHLAPLRDPVGQVTHLMAVARDITEQKQAEQQLAVVQAELHHLSRVTAMGEMASAICHELKQPLTAIMNYVEAARTVGAKMRGPNAVRIRSSLEKAGAQVQRAATMMGRIRGFMERRETPRAPTAINAVVQDAMSLSHFSSKGLGIQVALTLAPGLPTVLIDRIQIEQVLVNLLRNAMEAMAEAPEKHLTVTTALADDRTVIVRVADTGPGISPDRAAELFVPFHSTKPNGLGVGLSISRGIVEAHGGLMYYEPGATGGAVFAFTLPRAPSKD